MQCSIASRKLPFAESLNANAQSARNPPSGDRQRPRFKRPRQGPQQRRQASDDVGRMQAALDGVSRVDALESLDWVTAESCGGG
jgi:hypothetical protein